MWSRSLFGFPIVDERDRRGRALVRGEIDQEPLAIGGHGVLLPASAEGENVGNANGKQGRRGPDFHRLALRRRLDWCRHYLAVQRQVKDFFAVLVPAWLCPALRGDLELPARSRKRLDVDLESPGFVRLVGDPLAVRRESALAFLKGSFI